MPSVYVKKYPNGRRQTRQCEQCGATFDVPNRTVARGAGRFCSRTCKHLAQLATPIPVECQACGKTFHARPCDITAGIRSCSWECRTINIRGEGNPHWRNAPDYRGWDWKSARTAALSRDNHRCVQCAATEQLVVHHITPWEQTQDNRLDNLQTLCIACHTRHHKAAATH